MLKKAVTVVAVDNRGTVITPTSNPEYGYIKLSQKISAINEKGWVQTSNRTALLKGKIADLIELGLKANDQLPGKIVVRESLTPTDPNDISRNIKYAGESGVPCMLNDQPIYRTTEYTTDENAQDVFIKHDNTDQIKDAQANAKALSDTYVSEEVSKFKIVD